MPISITAAKIKISIGFRSEMFQALGDFQMSSRPISIKRTSVGGGCPSTEQPTFLQTYKLSVHGKGLCPRTPTGAQRRRSHSHQSVQK